MGSDSSTEARTVIDDRATATENARRSEDSRRKVHAYETQSIRRLKGLKEGSAHSPPAPGARRAAVFVRTRFEGEPGTNPEELVAAAHAGCFSMAFRILGLAGFTPEKIETTATVTLESRRRLRSHREPSRCDRVHSGADEAAFRTPRRKPGRLPHLEALNATITMDARLA